MRMYGKQGGHVGASNTLPNDAVYEKACCDSKVDPFVTGYILLFSLPCRIVGTHAEPQLPTTGL